MIFHLPQTTPVLAFISSKMLHNTEVGGGGVGGVKNGPIFTREAMNIYATQLASTETSVCVCVCDTHEQLRRLSSVYKATRIAVVQPSDVAKQCQEDKG